MNRADAVFAVRRGAAIALAKAGWWRVRCPVCGGRFRSFLPAGRRPRPNAECPRCGALERHRLQWLFLRERTDLLTRPQRLLHIAAEPSFVRRFARMPHLEYVTADRQPAAGRVCIDITNAGLAGDTFDAILCSHVLEHITDDAAAMAELFRLLRPGGWAMVQVPLDESREHTFEDPAILDPAQRELYFDQADHVRVYGRDYAARLERAGFSVQADRFAYSLTPSTVARYALLPETIFMCRKMGRP